MGRKCCVPECHSNYDTETSYTPGFQFPVTAEQKALWIRAINREDFKPSASAVVCVKHFEERFIIREDRVTRDDGSVLIVKRKKLGLSVDAIPTIFPNQPKYLSKSLPPARKLPSKRTEEILARDDMNFVKWCLDDTITSFEQFVQNYETKLTNDWSTMKFPDCVVVYKMSISDYPQITVSFKICEDLSVKAYSGSLSVEESFEWLLGAELKCSKWTQFENLLCLLKSERLTYSTEMKFVDAINLLQQCCSEMDNEEKRLKLNFFIKQLKLIEMKQLRYSTEILLWSSKLFFTYPAAYNCVRDSHVLTLPHPCYLQKLTKVVQAGMNSSHCTYLKQKSSMLKEEEKLVNLLLDEIYVNPSVNYKGGRIYGLSENSETEATTIQSFMITSVFSRNKDIVALYPVSNMNAEQLKSFCLKVLDVVHECGFTVLSLIADNNKVNNKMFSLMCGGTLQPFISNPQCPGKKLFFLFDSVHLIKSVRNNWMNQIATNEVLYFPHPETSKICRATLSLLKSIHNMEKNSVAKVAPKLNLKVLYPTSVERQNVSHALSLFHVTNCVALEMKKSSFSAEDVDDTVCFMKQMIDWWNIMNVKHPSKGKHLRQSLSNPIFDVNGESVVFLRKFSEWVSECINLRLLTRREKQILNVPSKGGLLSKETASALKFSTDCIILIIEYLFQTVGPSYILLGKFQTDNLEARFGQYRQMSGGNYHVSCVQVMESETKLKILSLISLYVESRGEFKIKDLSFNVNLDSAWECEIPDKLLELFNSNDDEEVPSSTMGVLIYIAGYVCHKVCEKLSCEKCAEFLQMKKNLSLECQVKHEFFSFLKLTDRGGLKWPQKVLINSTIVCYQLFVKILKKYEMEFLTLPNPKQLLVQLAIEKLVLLDGMIVDICECSYDRMNLLKHCLSALVNIFLNNFTKIRNDKINSNRGKRKLEKFAS